MSKGFSKSNKKSRISKSKDKKTKGSKENWCDKCKMKHIGNALKKLLVSNVKRLVTMLTNARPIKKSTLSVVKKDISRKTA